MDRKKNKFSVNRLMSRVKDAQDQWKTLLKDGSWMDDARQFLDRQRKDVQKLIHGDIEKLKDFLERERSGLEALQKQIPAELKRWKKYLKSQRQELEQILSVLGPQKKSRKKRQKRASKAPSRPTKKKKLASQSAPAS